MTPRKYPNLNANKGRAGVFYACKFIRFILHVLRAFFCVCVCLYNWIYNYASTDKEKSIKEKNK